MKSKNTKKRQRVKRRGGLFPRFTREDKNNVNLFIKAPCDAYWNRIYVDDGNGKHLEKGWTNEEVNEFSKREIKNLD